MNPIEFHCSQLMKRSANDICMQIVDTANWSYFKGAGMLPGIAHAEYERRTDDMIGSRIRVQNTDGSQHVEEIYRWTLGQDVAMRFENFTPPLRRLATHFTEEWRFASVKEGTHVTRTFKLYPKNVIGWLMLQLISYPFKQAIAKHMQEMAQLT